MHHGIPTHNRKECNLRDLWKISAVCMAKKCRDAAFHIAFAIHVSLGSTQPLLLRSAPRAARVAPLEEVVTAHPHHRALRNTNQPHGMGAVPPRKKNPRKFPAASCGTGGSIIMPAKGFFPNKNAAAPHARKNVWSVARKGLERENSRKDNTGSHEQPAHANTPLPRISPKIKITKKHATSKLQIASAVAADTPAWACAAPRCSAL
ncbi:hypothetical protein TCDM_10971 [Trypanosoma cruzi Dm28c]|uniref:Uncharacterized protein n=1 Tax=Trypanosoma cruzi Dm28c TaxID=1416333 RepID=V5AL81_TRYCR|nr:hypothetical protein TCDM_10971 [Trypanosoma cruzi Dm28c]